MRTSVLHSQHQEMSMFHLRHWDFEGLRPVAGESAKEEWWAVKIPEHERARRND